MADVLQKMVDGVVVDLTAEETAAFHASAAAQDVDFGHVRSMRNGTLSACDWTQLPDAVLTSHTAEEWAAYRQALRDIPANFESVHDFEVVGWPEVGVEYTSETIAAALEAHRLEQEAEEAS